MWWAAQSWCRWMKLKRSTWLYSYSQMRKVHFDGMCVEWCCMLRLKSTETDGNFDIDTAGDHTNPTPPSEDTPLRDVCLSLPFTRRVGANVGWHSDTLADVFWHCEDPSCAFTYAMTQISILPHTPSTLIRVAQLNERLTSVSPWPQQPLHVSVHATLNLIAHWLDNDSKVGEVWMSIN